MIMVFPDLPRRWERLRRQVRAVRRATDDVKAQTDRALRALGVHTGPSAPVVDVGDGARAAWRGIASRATQGIAVAVATVLLGMALVSLGFFVGAALLAFVVLTRGLGLRVELRPPRPA